MSKRAVTIVCPRCAQVAEIVFVRRFDPAQAAHREQVRLSCPSGCALDEDDLALLRASGAC
jgi:hypothetical protein